MATAIQFPATKTPEEQTYEAATFRLDQVPVYRCNRDARERFSHCRSVG
jgi:hypothetical protein